MSQVGLSVNLEIAPPAKAKSLSASEEDRNPEEAPRACDSASDRARRMAGANRASEAGPGIPENGGEQVLNPCSGTALPLCKREPAPNSKKQQPNVRYGREFAPPPPPIRSTGTDQPVWAKPCNALRGPHLGNCQIQPVISASCCQGQQYVGGGVLHFGVHFIQKSVPAGHWAVSGVGSALI